MSEQKQFVASKTDLAIVLNFFFGCIGLSDFYCNKKGSGTIKLLCTILVIASPILVYTISKSFLYLMLLYFIPLFWNTVDLFLMASGKYKQGDSSTLSQAKWGYGIAILNTVIFIIAVGTAYAIINKFVPYYKENVAPLITSINGGESQEVQNIDTFDMSGLDDVSADDLGMSDMDFGSADDLPTTDSTAASNQTFESDF